MKSKIFFLIALISLMIFPQAAFAECSHATKYATNISSQYVDDTYHITFWTCTNCNRPVNYKFEHKNDGTGKCKCGYCYHIAEQAKNVFKQYVDDIYHITTWTCGTCNRVISDKFEHKKNSDGRCSCGYCYHPIAKATNVYSQYLDNEYHSTTWTCSLCGALQNGKFEHTLDENGFCKCGYASHYTGVNYSYYNNYNNNYNYNNNINNNYTGTSYINEIKEGRCYAVGDDGAVYKRVYTPNIALQYTDYYVSHNVNLAGISGQILIKNGNALYNTSGVAVMQTTDLK